MNAPQIKKLCWTIKQQSTTGLEENPAGWICNLATANLKNRAWLLAFGLSGAVWGVLDPTESDRFSLTLGDGFDEAHPPAFMPGGLQEIFIFNQEGQIHAWSIDHIWSAAITKETEQDGVQGDAFDQDLYLWGSRVVEVKAGFCLLREGAQEMYQAVPVDKEPSIAPDRSGAPRLRVRNYLKPDPESGAAYIAATRLVQLV